MIVLREKLHDMNDSESKIEIVPLCLFHCLLATCSCSMRLSGFAALLIPWRASLMVAKCTDVLLVMVRLYLRKAGITFTIAPVCAKIA